MGAGVARVNIKLFAKRLGFLALVIWAASTIVFLVASLSPRNAIRERFAELARSGGFSPGDLETLISNMNTQFGLDRPLLDQYWTYLGNILRLDFGYSLNRYPSTVTDIISQALPWTFGLLLVTGLGLGGTVLLSPDIHRVGLALAVGIGAATIGLGALRHGRTGPLVIGACGIALMTAAVIAGHGPSEAVLTIAGVSLVALAHIRNLRQPA